MCIVQQINHNELDHGTFHSDIVDAYWMPYGQTSTITATVQTVFGDNNEPRYIIVTMDESEKASAQRRLIRITILEHTFKCTIAQLTMLSPVHREFVDKWCLETESNDNFLDEFALLCRGKWKRN